jgi:hypothetical protein
MAPVTFSFGNSSRMSPKAKGRTPPPIPWITRAMIITATESARAAIREPAVSATNASTKNRSFPNMSPRRPMIGVKIEADKRYAVSTHVTVFWEVWRPTWMVAITGMTSNWSGA